MMSASGRGNLPVIDMGTGDPMDWEVTFTHKIEALNGGGGAGAGLPDDENFRGHLAKWISED